MCDMVPFRDVVRTVGFLPAMLSSYDHDMYRNMEMILTRATWRYATTARQGSCVRFFWTFRRKMVTIAVTPMLGGEGIVSHQ